MLESKTLLIIGLVWPEPTSSAAGTRMLQLIHFFLARNYKITFASAASKSNFSFDLEKIGVIEKAIILNDESFNFFIKALNPNFVMFDRFVMEEQYGWRVQQECTDAMTILDTEDLHFLRHARQKSLNADAEDLYTETAKREIASILRCDISLIISEYEVKLLKEEFNINHALLYYLPFLEEKINQEQIDNWVPFSERADFIFIGNFLHEPNWHTVQVLKTKIWPLIRKKLPKAKMHIYGAYPSQKVLQLNNTQEHFYIFGRANDAKKEIAKHRVLLAPIQFGAGAKGKFIDAMHTGTPSVTTNVGAESMRGESEWNGFIEDDFENFVNQALILYENQEIYLRAQQNGVEIINQRYNKIIFEDNFNKCLNSLNINLKKHRQQNFIGQILHHQANQSTKYMSLWIEEKNK